MITTSTSQHCIGHGCGAQLLRTRILLLATSLATGACSDIADPGGNRYSVVMDVRPLTGALAALGDGASIVQDVELVVFGSDESVVLHVTETIGPTDSIAEFDVELDPETYTFSAFVYSNTAVLLYSGATVARVPESFPVLIVPQPMAAVMVVSPRVGDANQPPVVRNVGSQLLVWRVDCISVGTGGCLDDISLPSGEIPPGGEQPASLSICCGEFQVRFTSNEGHVTVTATRAQAVLSAKSPQQ